MKAISGCIPCIFNQIYSMTKRVTSDEWLHKKVLFSIMEIFPELDFERTPAEISFDCIKKAMKIMGIKDPYKEVKYTYNKILMEKLPFIQKKIRETEDPLYTALRMATASNIIDMGILQDYGVEKALEIIEKKDFALSMYREFKNELEKSNIILYIFDNAGEIVFDRIVVELLLERKKEVIGVVRKAPIINDVTREDVEQIGLDKIINIVDPGSEMLGIILSLCSQEFKKLFFSADLLISKGQANYETLDESHRDIYFLLMAKCPYIYEKLGVNEKDIVLFKGEKNVIA